MDLNGLEDICRREWALPEKIQRVPEANPRRTYESSFNLGGIFEFRAFGQNIESLVPEIGVLSKKSRSYIPIYDKHDRIV